MIKRRDTVAIESVGKYLLQSISELEEEKKLMEKNINSINDNYHGEDANIIISKFIAASEKMNLMEKIIEYYGQYMIALANHDKENIKYTSNQIISILNDPVLLNTTNNLNTETINEVKNV